MTDSLRLLKPSDAGPDGEPAMFDRDEYTVPSEPPHGPVPRGAPAVPTVAIRRERLERLLDDHPERRVVLVRGPAGAGKTVLVAQWIRAHDQPCAWLSIDASHSDPDHLSWHLAEALGRLSPDAIDRTVALPPTGSGLDQTVLLDLLDAVTHDLGTPIVLAVDDVHRLRDPAARQVLGRLVENPPASVRLVLIARSKPRLGLERARLRGDLVEVPPAALCFDRAEINALAGAWTGRLPAAAELEQTTLGWTAGLRLAQMDADPDDVPFAGPSEPDAVAREYICEELFDADPGDVRPFLEVSCWLPVLTEPLRVAVTEQLEGDRPWSAGELDALPIQPIASRPGTFRYPPILRRVVQQEYRRRDPHAALDACRRAAEACRSAGELVTSIELFLQAGCVDEAAAACGELAARGEASLGSVDELLRRHLATVGEDDRLLPWRIRAAAAVGRVDEGRSWLDRADRAIRATDRPAPTEGPDLVTARAILAERAGDTVVLSRCADDLLATTVSARTAPGSERQVRDAHGWRVRALVWSGDVVAARAALRALEQSAAGSTPAAAADIALARAWIAWLDGDVTRTTDVAAAREDGHGDEHAAELDLLAGSAHRERSQPAKALTLVQEARTLAVAAGREVVAALAASELARCHRTAGSSMEALELVVSTRVAHPRLPPAVDAHLRTTEVRVRLDQADLAGARAVLHDAPPGADTQLLAARIDLHHASAPALLEEVEPRTSRQAVEKLLLLSQRPDSDPADATAALVEAIACAEPLGLVRTFLDEGPTLTRRLQELASGSRDRTVGRLAALASQELALGATPESTDPVDQLTSRELAVLRMLPLRMSNREMAAQLYISVNTLKSHVRAIYRKLDVPHRSAAVSRARALQLV